MIRLTVQEQAEARRRIGIMVDDKNMFYARLKDNWYTFPRDSIVVVDRKKKWYYVMGSDGVMSGPMNKDLNKILEK